MGMFETPGLIWPCNFLIISVATDIVQPLVARICFCYILYLFFNYNLPENVCFIFKYNVSN